MGENTSKVYTVKVAFEANGFAYAVGEKYELTDEVVATLAPDTVELFDTTAPAVEAVILPAEGNTDGGAMVAETPAPTEEVPLAGATTPATETPVAPAAETPAAPSWAGGHEVGRE